MQQPSNSELEILKTLWVDDPKSARDIHTDLESKLNWGYSSTRKTLERMTDKGLVRSEASGNKNIYFANVGKVETLALIAKDFASRVFELQGDVPAAMFSKSELMSESEIKELENLLKQGDKKK